ncbi:Glycosyl transferase, group 1 [Rivularia sp. IAM M-261]|nr:Glycosyl transferase, group 1 [Rivularia sp. IAM M-261]
MTQFQVKVLMVGESPTLRGGIASVQKIILGNSFDNINFTHLATVEAYPSDPTLPKVFVFCRAIVTLLIHFIKRDIDLIHAHISERGSVYRKLIVAFLALLFRTPIILHTHGSEFHLFYDKQPQIIKWVINRVFSKSNLFIVLSESWKTFYVNKLGLLPKQVIVMPNPVKLPFQVPKRKDSDKVKFISLGRIGERKGSFDLLRAFASLPKDLLERSELILAGDGDHNVASSLVRELNLEDYVTIYNWLDSHQRDKFLADVNVFVLPSYNEGLPMALLEAMSFALPVITTPVGGIPEVITHKYNGFLVQPGDIYLLSEAIKMLIEDESLRVSLGYEAAKSVAPFSAINYCTQLSKIYQSIL